MWGVLSEPVQESCCLCCFLAWVFSVHEVDGHFDGFRMSLLHTEKGPCMSMSCDCFVMLQWLLLKSSFTKGWHVCTSGWWSHNVLVFTDGSTLLTFNQMKPGQVSYYKYARACISLLMCHFVRIGVDLNQLERVLTSDWAPPTGGSSVGQTSQEDRPQSDVVGVSWQKEVQKWKVEIDTRLA